MSLLAANPAGLSSLSPCLVERANVGLPTRNDGGEWHPSYGGHSRSNSTVITWDFRSQCADDNFALERICRVVSRLMLGHRFGAFPAPGGTRSSASRFHPSKPTPGLPGTPISAPLRGLGSSQNKFAKRGANRRANFFRAPPRKQTFGTREPGPLARLRPV
jgi:hypothetical protein